MRIAMIHTPFLARSGGERQILKLAIELEKRGHHVEIFSNQADKTTYPELFAKATVNIVPFNEQKHYGSLNKIFRKYNGVFHHYTSSLPAMLEISRKIPKEFDIINPHNFPTEWAAFLAKAKIKVPIVWMCNEPPYWFDIPEEREHLKKIAWPMFELWDKLTADYIDEIMVLSHVAQEYVYHAYRKKATVVRTGVDLELLEKATGENIRRLYCLEKDFVLLQAGGVDYLIKHQDYTIKALSILSKKHRKVKLIIDGPGNKEPLMVLAEKLGVKDKIVFRHSKSDKELSQVYASCDVFVYPSEKSTWGMGLTEAMGASKAVIVSKSAGVSEIIQSGVNGLVMDKSNSKEIAKNAELLIENPGLRSKIGENAYQYVKSSLTWEKYGESVETIFFKTLKNKVKN
jgi:glycosyltransferase involved in cell wall biosynthesis